MRVRCRRNYFEFVVFTGTKNVYVEDEEVEVLKVVLDVFRMPIMNDNDHTG